MDKRFAIVIGVAATGMMALGAQSAAAQAPNLCIAEDGVVLEQTGTATCEATGEGSFAKAEGAESTATATGAGSFARAREDGSTATATGEGSFALARGDGSTATATGGNKALATGVNSVSQATVGDNNKARIRGDNSLAIAGTTTVGGSGDDNKAIIHGNGSFANAGAGNGNIAHVRGDSSTAHAVFGDRNTATVMGDSSTAIAGGNLGANFNDNTATVTGNGSDATAMALTGCTAEAIGNGMTDACPPPPPPPGEPRALFQRSGILEPLEGTVLFKLPGSNQLVELQELTEVPMGTKVDATNGHALLTTQKKPNGPLQSIELWAGAFNLGQKRKKNITVLTLASSFAGAAQSRAGAETSGRRKKRRLWGRGKCRCRHRGRNSSGTSRGTWWLTAERRRGTLTKVKRGKVEVRDFKRRKKVLVRGGEKYLARN